MVETGQWKRIAFVAPTAADARDVMVEGESGILACCPPWNRPTYEPSKRRVVWPSGALVTLYSADEPERLRGPQHDGAWCDELGSWRYAEAAWDMLMFGLRLGKQPRAIITTTPKPTRLIRDLVKTPSTRVTRGSTFDNSDNLAASFFQTVVSKYEGTRLGRQELYAAILEQADGALWTREMIEKARWRDSPHNLPTMRRIVIAIDPAASDTIANNETGIVAAGLGFDGRGYILRDVSGHYSPEQWARKAIDLYEELDADRIIGEVNNGGDMIRAVLNNVSQTISYRAVHASRGKAARAEPIAALYEQGRVSHAAASEELEDQLCTWEPLGDQRSPDRLDALVWALTDLFGRRAVGTTAKPIVSSVSRRLPGSVVGTRRFAAAFGVGGGSMARKPGTY